MGIGKTGLAEAIDGAVRRMTEGRRVAVAFSGGLDSGLVSALASKYAESVTLYTCGSDGSFDVLAGRELADALGLPWVHVGISVETVEDEIRRLIAATSTDDPFTISYELQLFTVCENCDEQVVLSGQGADEYFMGCAKYVECAECDYLGIVSGNKVKDKVARAGLTWVRSEKVDAPLFDQLPLAFECKVASLDEETGILRAKILDTLAEESILTEGKIDPRKLGAIAFDGATSSYLLVGEEVAKAFSVGKKHL